MSFIAFHFNGSTQDSNQFWMICFRRSPLSLLLNGSHCLIGFVVSFDVLVSLLLLSFGSS